MGLFRRCKEQWALVKEMRTMFKAEWERAKRWHAITQAEAETLSDEELWDCITSRLPQVEEPEMIDYTATADTVQLGAEFPSSYAVLIVASDDRERLTRRFSSEVPTIAQIKDIYVRLMNYLGVAIGEGKFCSMAVNLYDFCARNRLFMGTVQNALKMLQQNGYLVFTDDEENPARLMFCVSRDDLYSLRVEREDLDNILRTILRLYTGVFTGLRPVDVQEMAIYTG